MLTVRVVKTPTLALANYKAGVGNAGPAWTDGALNPKRGDFRVNGAKQEPYWASQVAAAALAKRYSSNLSKVTDQFYTTAVSTYGQANYQTQAVAKADKWNTFYTKFAPALETILKGLPARGNYAANKARLTAYLDALQSKKGQFKV
jgi:hypothetical protein